MSARKLWESYEGRDNLRWISHGGLFGLTGVTLFEADGLSRWWLLAMVPFGIALWFALSWACQVHYIPTRNDFRWGGSDGRGQ